VARSAYRIHTNRLLLRCWSPQDAPLLASAITESLGHLRPWMPWAAAEPEPLRRKVRRLRRMRANFDQGRDFIWGIFDPGERCVIGGCGLHRRIGAGAAEIGYWIHVDHAGQGLGTEAAAALTCVGFEVQKLRRIEIHCDPANAASAAIPCKLGYDHQVTVRDWTAAPDMPPRDTMFWTLLAGAYPGTPAAAAAVEAFGADGAPLPALARHMGVSN
jgi:RimJ/RimL family protein N-acetyltransferase